MCVSLLLLPHSSLLKPDRSRVMQDGQQHRYSSISTIVSTAEYTLKVYSSIVTNQHRAVTGSEVQLLFNCLSPLKMSSDIYAKPDFSKKVRYNRKVQEDNVEWEEREVAIYESTDDIRDDHTDLQSHDAGPHTENHPPAVQSRPFRAAAFCLGVLCFLTITGIILLYIRFSLEKDQLQTRYDKLYKNYSELQGQLLAVNISQLQSSYETLRKNHSQLQDEVKQLKDKLDGEKSLKTNSEHQHHTSSLDIT
ncbi:uncharacterized protein LOC119906783 [Micropterus salmoides]|uniref:uncharacterized protein LOC119906783 n=1 Tax=Micropterus salmoides TaxID=27706 RepID=UPI0018EA390A|nr:uncharacterized protein LOC119906783 [Micropterus salmoides]